MERLINKLCDFEAELSKALIGICVAVIRVSYWRLVYPAPALPPSVV